MCIVRECTEVDCICRLLGPYVNRRTLVSLTNHSAANDQCTANNAVSGCSIYGGQHVKANHAVYWSILNGVRQSGTRLDALTNLGGQAA